MRKLFSYFVLALCLMVSTQVKADGNVAKIGSQEYATLTEAFNAVQDGQTIILINEVPKGSMSDNFVIYGGKKVILDMNNHNITTEKLFYIYHGSLEIKGKGTITEEKEDVAFRLFGSKNDVANYSVFTLGKDVVLQRGSNPAQWLCGVGILHVSNDVKVGNDVIAEKTLQPDGTYSSYGVVVNISGKMFTSWFGITTNGSINATTGENIPQINVYPDAIISDVALTPGNEGCGIYAAGYAKWNIQGSVSGAIGLYIKAGELDIEDANIAAIGAYREPEAYGNGMDGSGDAIVCDSHGSYAGAINVSISGDSKIEAQDGNAIHEVITQGETEKTQKIDLQGGTFIAGGQDHNSVSMSELGKDNEVAAVTGGSYNTPLPGGLVDENKGGILVWSVDANGNDVLVVSNNGTGTATVWKTDLLANDIDETSYVRLEGAATIDVDKDITCAFLSFTEASTDKIIVKNGHTLTVGEIVLGESNSIEVEAGAKLLVTGDRGLYSPKAECLVLKASATAMATFAFNPAVNSNRSPWATVEYYTTARYRTTSNDYKLDIFAFPFVKGTLYSVAKSAAIGTNYQHVVNGAWVEFADQNAFMANAEPFEAIAFTNNGTQDDVTYTFKGRLQGNISGKLNLKAGFNYIGNPFMAPMTTSDIIANAPAQVDRYIALWTGKGYLGYNGVFSDAPIMKPMNMFVIWAKEDVVAEFNYETLIWNNVK